MNYTLDDTASQLLYSSGWASQSLTDPNLPLFFEGSYHAAQFAGATLNLSVQGSALYIYGSKGPNHAGYCVQVDDVLFPNLTANASTLAFQQLLFSHSFDLSPDVHFVSLTALPNGTNDWLDIDFVTVASGNASTDSDTPLPNTVSVPWSSSSLTTVGGAPSASTEAEAAGAVNQSDENHSTKLNTATEVLAVVFGLIIALVILLLAVYWFLRRRYDRQRAREHSFRLGRAEHAAAAAAVDKFAIGEPTNFEHKESGSVDGNADPLPTTPSQVHLLSPPGNASTASLSTPSLSTKPFRGRELILSQPPTRPPDSPLPSPPQSPGFASLASTLTAASASSAVTKSSDVDGKVLYMLPDVAASAGPASPSRSLPFAFLSQAPSAFPMNLGAIRRGSKGDADSLKTDFLQV